MPNFVVYVYPKLLGLLLAAWAWALARNFKTLNEDFSALITRRGRLAAALLCALCAILIAATAPAHRDSCDEFTHLDIARNLERLGTFSQSLASGLGHLNIFQTPPWPGGFHVILALSFRMFGFSEFLAFKVNAAAGIFGVLVVFLAATHLWKNQAAGAFAALIFSLDPLYRVFSASTDPVLMSQLWIAASVLALFHDLKHGTPNSGLFLLATGLYATQLRPENILLLPLLLSWRLWGQPKRPISKRAAAAALALTLLVAAGAYFYVPALLHHPISPAQLAGCFLKSAPANLAFFLHPRSVYAVLSPLALYGAVSGLQGEHRRHTLFLACLFAALFVVYSSYPHHKLGLLVREPRYVLGLDLPLTLLAGLGLSAMTKSRFKPLAFVSLAGYAALALWPGAAGPEFQHSSVYRQDEAFLRASAGMLPADAYVVGDCPAAIMIAAHKPALHPNLIFENNQDVAKAISGTKGPYRLVLYQDFWWNWRKHLWGERLFSMLQRDYDFHLINRAGIDGQEHAFWGLNPKEK